VSDELIGRMMVLSERYISDRFLPDKAIDLLDESCSCAALRNKAASELAGVEKELASLKQQEEQLMQTEGQDIYKQLADFKSEECRLLAKAQGLRDAAGEVNVTDDDVAQASSSCGQAYRPTACASRNSSGSSDAEADAAVER
jgi:ATP-dependent Clp protease ATP-binding subunit ClpA